MKNTVLSALLLVVSPAVFAAEAQQGPGMISNIVMLGGFFLIFYFMLIRPQSKRAKDHQNLIKAISTEDEVITNGGLVGKVLRVTDQFLVLSIAEGIEVKVQKQSIMASVPKGTMSNI